MHTPRYDEAHGSKTLVVFIHGFMGSPNQYDDMMTLLSERSVSAMTLLLPGHGGTAKDFAACRLAEWESHLQTEIDKYKARYSSIYLVGHSMGGLLALCASIRPENKVRGVMLLSTPMKIRYLAPDAIFKRSKLLFYKHDHEIKRGYTAANSVARSGVLYYPLWIRPAVQLMRLIRKTGEILPKVTSDVVIIHSKGDETVSIKSAELLYKGLSNARKTAVTLERSWHAYYTAEERARICDELVALIDR